MSQKLQTSTHRDFPLKKDSLQIPKIQHKQGISLSDIIAATIGEDTRSADTEYEDFYPDYGLETQCAENCNNIIDSTNEQESNTDLDLKQNVFLEDSNNDFDPHNVKQLFSSMGPMSYDSGEHSGQAERDTNLHTVPEIVSDQDSNTIESSFNVKPPESNGFSQLDFSNLSFDINSSVGFHTEYMTDFISNLCESKETEKLSSPSLQVVPEHDEKFSEASQTNHDAHVNDNVSYDSDLEDSVHFVLPEEPVELHEFPDTDDSLQPRKRRRSECFMRSCDMPDLSTSGNAQLKSPHAPWSNCSKNLPTKYHPRGIQRARSFSGNITHRTVSNNSFMNSNGRSSSFKTPSLNRTRSFSGTSRYDACSPLDEERFNTSLNSLLGSPSESNSLSENPFFDDLKSTLFTDCTSTNCPETLLTALSEGPKLDVYARERNLQARFSSLQSKYSEEVRELSSFYRCQSAEVETQRFRELHEENLPLSFRNHLNRYYDDQLHMIMERVERSLQLLTVAKRDIVTINRSIRPRPLLSRKAVSMMEEWYTRNYEHPYPSQTAVEALATAGEINQEQVKKWFANKRNRSKNILPMTEVMNKKRKRQFSSRW